MTLSSGTPYLPFLGNQLVEVSYVPNATDIADVTAVYTTDLRRQSNCSLDEDFTLPTALTPSAGYIASVTGAQDYLHQLAGLTTTPDVFANGCDYQVLGLPTTTSILLLGTTVDGAVISAQVDLGDDLVASVTDPVANTVTTTTLDGSGNVLSFSAASLRGNGIMDVVEPFQTDPATSKPAIAVFLGNGDGTFKPPVYYDVAGDFNLTIDDVNGDGIPDIVVGGTGTLSSSVIVTTLIGKGDGTFTIGPVSTFTVAGGAGGMVTGDFNGDGKKDLLIGGNSVLIGATVLFGGGDGTFTQGPTTAGLPGASAVGDLRNNGKLDVVVSERGSVAIFYGNGDGTFAVGPRYAGPVDTEQVTITDIDGDGNQDIVIGTSTGGIYTLGGYDTQIPMFQILMGRGDGTFVDSLVYNQGNYNTGSVEEIASADFTGDGKLDLLVLNPIQNGTGAPSQLIVLPGDGKGNLGTAINSPINIVPELVVEADMNGDGKPDAVVAGSLNGYGGRLAVLINQGNGTFAGEQDYSLPSNPVNLAVGDFNGDGLLDVAVGVSGGVYVLLGQANGTLGAPVQIDSSLNPSGLAAGSLTSDGRTDLIVADQGVFGSVNGALHVYLGNADGTFTTMAQPSTSAASYTVAALGDLNKDGKLDLIVAGGIYEPGTSGTFNVYTFLGNGDGTFQAANTEATGGLDISPPSSIALADFNHDGNLDVAVGDPADYTEVLFGNGDGTLTDTIMALGQLPGFVAAADLLGNGFPELLVGQGAEGAAGGANLTVFLNSTTAWTAAAAATTPTVTVTPSPTSFTTAQSTMVTIAVGGGSGGATPTGSVTLSGGGYTSAATTLASGSAVITVPAGALATGSDTLTATYTPDSTSSSVYNSATGTNSVTVTAALTPTFALSNGGNINVEASAATGNTSTITVTPANGFTGAVNLTCALTTIPTGAISPATCGVTSSVTINGTTALTATLTVTTTSTTTAGAYAVTVTGISGAITQTTVVDVTVTAFVPPPTFALTNSGAITISSPGATTGNTATITVTPSGGLTGNVALTAAIATSPAGATDLPTFSFGATTPVSITGASAGTGTLTVTTTAATTAALARPKSNGASWYAAGGATLACLLFIGIPVRRRRWRTMLGMLVLLAFLTGAIVSCGGGSGGGGGGGTSNPGTTTGSYTITVTGTSGSTTQTTTVNLTVN